MDFCTAKSEFIRNIIKYTRDNIVPMEIVQFKRNVAYANNSKHVYNVQCHRVTQKGQDKKCKNHKRQKNRESFKEIFSSKLVSVDEGAFNLPDYH